MDFKVSEVLRNDSLEAFCATYSPELGEAAQILLRGRHLAIHELYWEKLRSQTDSLWVRYGSTTVLVLPPPMKLSRVVTCGGSREHRLPGGRQRQQAATVLDTNLGSGQNRLPGP